MKKEVATKNEKEAEILFPDRSIEIGGKTVTVKELTFGQQMQYGDALEAIASNARFQQVMESGDINGVFASLGGELWEKTRLILSVCCDLSPDEIDALPSGDGILLLSTWINANTDFFVTRLVWQSEAKKLKEVTSLLATGSQP